VERIGKEIDARVDARLAQASARSALTSKQLNMLPVVALGSIALGIPISGIAAGRQDCGDLWWSGSRSPRSTSAMPCGCARPRIVADSRPALAGERAWRPGQTRAIGPRINGEHDKRKLDEIVEHSLRQAALWDEVKHRLKASGLACPADRRSGCASPAPSPSSRTWSHGRARLGTGPDRDGQDLRT
jgi:hypothetical protein